MRLLDFCFLIREISKNKEKHNERKITRDENTLYRFTNWVDTLARRTRYAYIKKGSKHISHACIVDVPEDVLRAEEIEISYTFSEGEGRFEFEIEWLMKAFTELSKTRKRLLELLYVEEKTPQEAAKILGCTVENIYNQHSKAFKVIKKIRKEGKSNENDE